MAPVTRSTTYKLLQKRGAELERDDANRCLLHEKFNTMRVVKKKQSGTGKKPTTKGAFSVLNLPGELRNMVNASAAQQEAPLYLDTMGPLPWMIASKATLQESTPAFLNQNAFRTLIARNANPNDMRYWDPSDARHWTLSDTEDIQAMGILPSTLRWLQSANCAFVPLIRDIGFGFSYDESLREQFFRVAYKGNNQPFICHGHCIFCTDDRGHGDHVCPVDPAHPALSPANLAADMGTTRRYGVYLSLKNHHDRALDTLQTTMQLETCRPKGIAVSEISEMAMDLRDLFCDGESRNIGFKGESDAVAECYRAFRLLMGRLERWDRKATAAAQAAAAAAEKKQASADADADAAKSGP